MPSIDSNAPQPIGDSLAAAVGSFQFNDLSPEIFSEHLKRSIPCYEQSHQLILSLMDHFISPNSVVYDVGCSHGVLLRKLIHRHSKKNIHWIGIEPGKSLGEHARLQLQAEFSGENIELCLTSLENVTMIKTELIAAIYTMQFIPHETRLIGLKKMFDALKIGGALVLFEKCYIESGFMHDILLQTYLDYKLLQQFTEAEVMAKMKSLRGVLNSWSIEQYREKLKQVGFREVHQVFQWGPFVGLVVVK